MLGQVMYRKTCTFIEQLFLKYYYFIYVRWARNTHLFIYTLSIEQRRKRRMETIQLSVVLRMSALVCSDIVISVEIRKSGILQIMNEQAISFLLHQLECKSRCVVRALFVSLLSRHELRFELQHKQYQDTAGQTKETLAQVIYRFQC